MILHISILMLVFLLTCSASATVYFDETFENITVGTDMVDNVANGVIWDFDTGTSPPTLVPNTVRATITAPNGSRYLEAHGLCTTYTNDRCTSGPTTNAGVQLTNSGGGLTEIGTLTDGTTYYLGVFLRYERVASRDVWQDTGSADSWNKTYEFAGTGTRWGIGAGWPSGNYTSTDHKYTVDLWCSNAVFPAWCVTDHPVQNASGHSASNPYLMDYEKWYAVVLGVTASTSGATGRIRLWVNGTLIMDRNQQTMNSGAGYDHHWIQSTFGQGSYDNPEAYYQMDYMIFSDSLTEIENAGLMSNPEAGGESGHVVMFISQGLGWITMVLQLAFILAYFWERRAMMIRAMMRLVQVMNLRQLYWILRYKSAVKLWQRRAPVMLEQHDVVILDQQTDGQWLLRK